MGGNVDSKERCERTQGKCKAPLSSASSLSLFLLRKNVACHAETQRTLLLHNEQERSRILLPYLRTTRTHAIQNTSIPKPHICVLRIKKIKCTYKISPARCRRVNKTIFAQNGGRGGCCYQDVWHHGRDTSRSTTPLEWPGATSSAGRIILTRYVG